MDNKQSHSHSQPRNLINVHVTYSFGGEDVYAILPYAHVIGLKELIQQRTGMTIRKQRVFLSGEELRNGAYLNNHGIKNGTRMFMAPVSSTGMHTVQLLADYPCPQKLKDTLPEVRRGLAAGWKPELVMEGLGGTYFMKNAARKAVAVFKPSDEEPWAPNNPKDHQGEFGAPGERTGVYSGSGYVREAAASLLDHSNFCGVPATALVEISRHSFQQGDDRAEMVSTVFSQGPSVLLTGAFASQYSGAADRMSQQASPAAVFRPRKGPIMLSSDEESESEHDTDDGAGDNDDEDEDEDEDSSSSVDASSYPTASDTDAGDDFDNNNNNNNAQVDEEQQEDQHHSFKVGMLQEFISYDFVSGDWSHKDYPVHEVHKIGILDIRVVNLDRNEANILVRRVHEENATTYELIPIDHSYSFPDALDLTWADWNWLAWEQSKEPFDKESLEYIESIDIDADIALLRQHVNISEPCLRLFRLFNMCLKMGAHRGLTLFEIASMLTRPDFDVRSEMENLCIRTIEYARLLRPHVHLIPQQQQQQRQQHSSAPEHHTTLNHSSRDEAKLSQVHPSQSSPSALPSSSHETVRSALLKLSCDVDIEDSNSDTNALQSGRTSSSEHSPRLAMIPVHSASSCPQPAGVLVDRSSGSSGIIADTMTLQLHSKDVDDGDDNFHVSHSGSPSNPSTNVHSDAEQAGYAFAFTSWSLPSSPVNSRRQSDPFGCTDNAGVLSDGNDDGDDSLLQPLFLGSQASLSTVHASAADISGFASSPRPGTRTEASAGFASSPFSPAHGRQFSCTPSAAEHIGQGAADHASLSVNPDLSPVGSKPDHPVTTSAAEQRSRTRSQSVSAAPTDSPSSTSKKSSNTKYTKPQPHEQITLGLYESVSPPPLGMTRVALRRSVSNMHMHMAGIVGGDNDNGAHGAGDDSSVFDARRLLDFDHSQVFGGSGSMTKGRSLGPDKMNSRKAITPAPHHTMHTFTFGDGCGDGGCIPMQRHQSDFGAIRESPSPGVSSAGDGSGDVSRNQSGSPGLYANTAPSHSTVIFFDCFARMLEAAVDRHVAANERVRQEKAEKAAQKAAAKAAEAETQDQHQGQAQSPSAAGAQTIPGQMASVDDLALGAPAMRRQRSQSADYSSTEPKRAPDMSPTSQAVADSGIYFMNDAATVDLSPASEALLADSVVFRSTAASARLRPCTPPKGLNPHATEFLPPSLLSTYVSMTPKHDTHGTRAMSFMMGATPVKHDEQQMYDDYKSKNQPTGIAPSSPSTTSARFMTSMRDSQSSESTSSSRASGVFHALQASNREANVK
jgi:Phosphatidylinositol 3- and 4-kinase/Ubiquitin family